MKRLIATLFQADPRAALVAIAASMLSGISAAAMAVILTRALQAETRGAALAAAFFAAAISHFALRVFSENRLIALTQDVLLGLRLSLARRLLATPHRRLQEIGRQPLHTILTRDMDTFVGAVQLIPLLIGNLLLILGCFAYLAWVSWQVCAVVLLCLLAGASLFKAAERRPIRRIHALREEIDRLYTAQRALVDGSKELQLNAARGSDYVDGVIGRAAAGVAREYVGAMSGYIRVINFGNSLFYLVIGAVLFLPWLGGADALPAVLVMLYLVRPVAEAMISLPALRQSAVALKRIDGLADSLAPDARPPVALPMTREITLAGVTHSYRTDSDDRMFTLGPVDLAIRPGEILLLAGGNGSGKTTLALLLAGLYAPESGRIEVDGAPVRHEERARYRQIFSAIFADFHLFAELPGSDDPETEARARHYIDRLGLGRKVTVSGGRLSTTDLSTGQRKRLALVSAWLEDRPVYLFDEWAADQDPAFKAVFYRELLPELKARGKAVIAITHDDAYYSTADRVITLAEGKIEVRYDRSEAAE
ncbi:cyclic peptide export ABC transporter [Frigidibacter sp. SD6-1]|uniref:cyclic peptide export ABC transporter n=1 Tax=Frigidibacter sp. SD6-1 TaxID=3032581 RepID=UPI0024DF8489|nr:cyclic peptide export ABC transporter [Frigidibacter sp. SD6-1]